MSVGIKLKHIVESVLIEQDRDTKHYYLPYLHLAIDGLTELNWDVAGATKMVTLTPDNQGVIHLPEDFVKEVRISALANDNTLIPLSRNNDIFKTVDNCGDYAGNQAPNIVGAANDNGFGFDTGNEHFSNGQFIGRYYGVGGRSTAGEFTINREKGEIWLGMYVNARFVILEYIGYLPERVGGNFIVHPFLKEPLMNWIHYASRRRKASPSEVEYLHKRYIDSKNWARQRFWNMDFTEVLDIARKNFTQSPSF